MWFVHSDRRCLCVHFTASQFPILSVYTLRACLLIMIHTSALLDRVRLAVTIVTITSTVTATPTITTTAVATASKDIAVGADAAVVIVILIDDDVVGLEIYNTVLLLFGPFAAVLAGQGRVDIGSTDSQLL